MAGPRGTCFARLLLTNDHQTLKTWIQMLAVNENFMRPPANPLENVQASESSPKPARYDFTLQLPAELLAEIFDMCSTPGDGFLSDATTPYQEVERLAKNYLLQLSQV